MTLPTIDDGPSNAPVAAIFVERHSTRVLDCALQIDVAKAAEADLALDCVYQGTADPTSPHSRSRVQGAKTQGLGSLVVVTPMVTVPATSPYRSATSATR